MQNDRAQQPNYRQRARSPWSSLSFVFPQHLSSAQKHLPMPPSGPPFQEDQEKKEQWPCRKGRAAAMCCLRGGPTAPDRAQAQGRDVRQERRRVISQGASPPPVCFPGCEHNYITVSCAIHARSSGIVPATPHPHVDLRVPPHDLRQSPCKEPSP